jgi:hypothetical protein
MDFAAIQGMMASLKAATDISKALVDLKIASEVQGKVIELQGALMTAQNSALEATNALYSLQDRVRNLESQVQAFQDWGEQEKRYALVACPWQNPVQVYALKKERADGEQAHYLCTNCFHVRKRVILNPESKDGWIYLSCPNCKSTASTGHRRIGAPKFAEDIGGEG